MSAGITAAGTDGIGRRMRRLAPGALLWALGFLVGVVTIRNWIQLNDEGLMLQAASRIADGEVPYRDFWWFYPPGQPYLLAGIQELTGPSLMPWRVVRAAADATVALLVWRLALRRAGGAVSMFAWLAAVLAVSSATGPHPYPIAMCFALGSILLLERNPVWAGVLAGAAAAWRIEFAAYLMLGCAVGLVVRGGWRSPILRYVGGAVGAAAVVYVPLVAVAGARNSWDLLVRYPVLEFGKYQTLPFPLVWDGGGDARGADLVAQVLSYHLPLALVLTLAASIASLLLARRPGGWIEVTTAIFAVGMAHYLLVRADAFHVGPLAIVDSVLVAWAVGAVGSRRRSRGWSLSNPGRTRTRIAGLLAGIAVLGLGWSIADTGWKRVREVREARASIPIGIDVADGAREMAVTRCSLRGEPLQYCRTRDLEDAVRWVRANVPSGSPIFVATKRSDLVTAGAPLFYVLAGRPNATRYDIAAPGVVTSEPVQLETIRALQRSGATVVRYSAGITAAPEPNEAGKSTGVTLLDDWLAANYVEVARFGVWSVLEPRSPAPDGGAEAR